MNDMHDVLFCCFANIPANIKVTLVGAAFDSEMRNLSHRRLEVVAE